MKPLFRLSAGVLYWYAEDHSHKNQRASPQPILNDVKDSIQNTVCVSCSSACSTTTTVTFCTFLFICDCPIFIWLWIKILCQLVHEVSGSTIRGWKQGCVTNTSYHFNSIWKRQLPQHAPTIQNDLGVASEVHCVTKSVCSLSICEVLGTEVIRHTSTTK